MKADQFKILWATAPERLEADRADLAALGEKDVQPFSVVGNAPADLQGQDTAVVLLPPRAAALDMEPEGEEVRKALLAAGVPAFTATRADLAEEGAAAWERRRARLVSYALEAARLTASSKERNDLLARLHLGDVLEEFSTPEERADPPLHPTGIPGLDRVLGSDRNGNGGGLREGVYILQGVPGGGKTALSLFLAANILKGNPEARVLYHSLEMSRRQIAAKVLARLAYDLAGAYGEDGKATQDLIADLHAPRELDWQTPSRLRALASTDTGARIQAAALDEFTPMASRFLVAYRGAWGAQRGQPPSIDRLAAIGKEVAKDGPAPVVFVDYLQLIPPPEDYRGERRDVVGYNSSMLEEMAHDLRTPVVVLSSMNRTAVTAAQKSGGTIGLGASKESGDIDYNADAVLSLADVLMGEGEDKRPLTFSEPDAHRSGKVVEVQVAKNRTGPSTFKGTHPRLDWLTEWGVYQTTRHPAGDEDGVGEAAVRAFFNASKGRR